jgi:CRISPR-associated protein Csb1
MWKELENVPRLLIEATLSPIQGTRFQPTGFPDLGPAEFTAPDGTEMLLVESAQSMANHLEAVCWDEKAGDLVEPLKGLPYVRSKLSDGRETNSILEAHRLNSPYIMHSKEGLNAFPELKKLENNPQDILSLAKALFKYDANCILHGVFLEKIAGGLRLRRILSAFIEAKGVRPADSGGVKIDRVDPRGEFGGGAQKGYGHVPFHRREYTAEEITAYFNVDLAQLRALGLGENADSLLIALALFKIRKFLEHGGRLRTACDLRCKEIRVTTPKEFDIPSLSELEKMLPHAIKSCEKMFASPPVTIVNYDPREAKRKAKKEEGKSEEQLNEEEEE